MPHIKTGSAWALLAAIGVTTYFAAAVYLDRTFIDPTPKGRTVIPLGRLLERSGHAAIVYQDFPDLPTDDGGKAGSPVVIYEDGVPLSRPHSYLPDVAKLGMGRYGHFRNGLVFSASDNTDPNSNGRHYWAVVP